MREQRFQLWTIDVKDAFLQLPQKSKVYVNPPRGYEHLLAEYSLGVGKAVARPKGRYKRVGTFPQGHLGGRTVRISSVEPEPVCKEISLRTGQGVVLVHVDDIQLAATPEEVRI